MADAQLSPREQTLVDSISRERLMDDTAAISRWIRLSGSSAERAAFEYIAGVIRDLGLEPRLDVGMAYISIPVSASLTINGRQIAAITHSMAASTGPQGMNALLVDAGAGNAGDFTSEMRGSCVLIDGLATPAKVLAGQEAGVAACIFANTDAIPHEMIVSGVWGSPEPEDAVRLPRIPVVSVGSHEAATIREMLRAGGRPEVHLCTEVDTRWREIPTLTAQLDAPTGSQDFVLFSGHVDSWHYGAMDNGTANATQLEVARLLLPLREHFQRGLRLAFWSGHSHGRYAGSAWYADNFWEDLRAHCVAHINIDSVGGQNADVLSEANSMAEAVPCAADVISALTGTEFTGSRFGRAGDQSFQFHGIPSLFMSLSEQARAQGDTTVGFAQLMGSTATKAGGLGWWWHTPEDTVDKIDPDLLARDARIYAVVVHRFVTAPVLPLSVRAAAEDLLSHIRDWQKKAGERFELAQVVQRAEVVVEAATRFENVLRGALAPEQIAVANAHLSAAERSLVRANYTQSGLFHNDPALAQPPVPLLSPIDQLLATTSGSDEANMLLVQLVRRRNALMHELSMAHRALTEGIALLGA